MTNDNNIRTTPSDELIEQYTELLHDGGYFEITSRVPIADLLDEMIGVKSQGMEITEHAYDLEQQAALIAASRWFIECIGGNLAWVKDRL